MGHIVNPVSYRLGASRCWNSVWPNDMSLTFSYSTLMKSDWDLFLFFKRFFDLKLIMQSGYIFSHVKVIRESKKIFCIVYFYDGGSLERSDNLKQILMTKKSQIFSIENMFFISMYSFLRLYQWNCSHIRLADNFKFSMLFNFFERKKKLILFKKFIRYSFLNSIERVVDLFLNFSFIMNLSLNDCVFFFPISSKKGQNNVLSFSFIITKLFFLFNNFSFFQFVNNEFLIKFYFNISFIFLKFKFSNDNFNLFFQKKLFYFFLQLRWKIFGRVSAIARMLRCGYQFLSFSRYFLHYFADNFFFYYRIKIRLLNALKSMIAFLIKKQNNFSNLKIILKKLEVSEINATIMSKYIAIRLRQRFQLKEALMPMLRHLSNNEYVKGFRIVCAGRFTRKEIALYDLRTYSSVPFSGVTSRLDFSLSEVVLKYSICGIKVWLHRYCLPEREHGIQAVGMNFMLPPPTHELFSEKLKIFEDVKEIPFRFEEMYDSYIKSKAKKILKPVRLLRYSIRLGPTYDFFFLNYPPRLNSVSEKIVAERDNLF